MIDYTLPAIPPDLLHTFILTDDYRLHSLAADHPSTSHDTLLAMANSRKYTNEHFAIAHRDDVTPVILTALARSHSQACRRGVAGNPATPADVLAGLADALDQTTATTAIRNPNTGTSVLRQASKSRKSSIRVAVAANPNTPIDILRHLHKSRHTGIRTTANTARLRLLRTHADTLTEPARSHAHLLINQGFPGWPDDLDQVLHTTPTRIEHPNPHRAVHVTVNNHNRSHSNTR